MRHNFGHSAGINLNAEQLPDERNYLELDPEVKDDYGMPVPRINLGLRKNDQLMSKAMKKKWKNLEIK